MGYKPIILPMDGFKSGYFLLNKFENIVSEPGASDLIGYVKINDAAHMQDMPGPVMLRALAEIIKRKCPGMGIFLDLKLADTKDTDENTASHYSDFPPMILTVTAMVNAAGFLKLRRLLPNTKLALVSALTDMTVDECVAQYGHHPDTKIIDDVRTIQRAYEKIRQPEDPALAFDYIVNSPNELDALHFFFRFTYGHIVPGIRDSWMLAGQQARIRGAFWALRHGATFLVMGAQMTKGNPGEGVSAEESRKRTATEIRRANVIEIVPGNPLETLKNCDGYYESPRDENGRYTGPLVAYAGDYESEPGQRKNFVGGNYYNIAKAEPDPMVREFFTLMVADEILKRAGEPDLIVGAPMGGIMDATDVGRLLHCRTIFVEKKITSLGDPSRGTKDAYNLVIERHEVGEGSLVVLFDDVCNNFKNTKMLIDLVESKGGKVICISCAVNRSGKDVFEGIPVTSAVYQEAEQYRQDDPVVADLIPSYVIWKPKQQWPALKKAMGK